MTEPARRNVYRIALRHAAARWMTLAFIQSRVGDFMYGVALIAVVFDRTGSTTDVAIVAVLVRLPLVVLPPFAGVLVDRVERRALMVTLDASRAAAALVLGLFVWVAAPVSLIAATAVVMAVLATPYGPAEVALTSSLIPEDDLAAVNALGATAESTALLAGPAIGGVALLLGSASLVFVIDAATFAVSALCLLQVPRGPEPRPSEGRQDSQLFAGFAELSRNRALAVVNGALVATCFTVGATTVLLLVVSVHRVGTGAHGFGYLMAASGIGGVVASAFGDRITRWRRTALVTLVSLVVVGVTILLLGAVVDLVEALIVVAVWGAAYILLEILSVTLLQRCVPPDVLGRATAAVDTLAFGAVLLGAGITGPVQEHAGLTVAVIVAAAPVGLAVLAIAGSMRSLDRQAFHASERLQPRVDVLRASPAFAGADAPALEALATQTLERRTVAGETIIEEGAPAKDFYVVVSGQFDVISTGGGAHLPEPVRTLVAGELFGEIGLVQQRPRTATVVARTDGEIYVIAGSAFLSAVNGIAPLSAEISDLASARLRHTHPGL